MSPSIAPGKKCGTCTLCCKVLSIAEIHKPQGSWCKHCDIGKGCRIYAGRPRECQTFYCGYLNLAELGEEWFPKKSKIVLVSELDGGRIAAHIDPGAPGAWKNEPYYSQLREWAERIDPGHGQVIAQVGMKVTVLLPHKEVDLGIVEDDELVVTKRTATAHGEVYEAMKIKKTDPRAAKLNTGSQKIASR